VSTPDQRARDSDREAAVRQVDAALASGRIVQADRDKRVQELRHAQTLAEVAMLVQDLPPLVAPPVPYDVPTVAAQPVSGSAAAASPRPLGVMLVAVLVVVVVSLVAGVVVLVRATGGSTAQDPFSGPDSGTDSNPDAPVDVLSVDGYAKLVGAVKAETGSTSAFSAVLYPTYAVVELPVDTTTQREEYWYWDGHNLTSENSKSTSSAKRLDLSTIDASVIEDLVAKVQTKVEEPTSHYAVLQAPSDDRTVIWAYASNEYSESQYLGARRDGTITYDSSKS